MNTRNGGRSSRAGGLFLIVAACATAFVASGCATMAGRPTSPLTAKREVPGVVLCTSERTSGGGIRIIGQVDPGIYPITRAAIEYRIAGASEAPPTAPDATGRLALPGARSEQVKYQKGAKSVAYSIDADAVRNLRDKVIWYRWLVTYDRGGSPRIDATDVHRTSAEEAGLPRAVGAPGPDTSVALPVTRRR